MMTLSKMNVDTILAQAKEALEKEKGLSEAFKAVFSLMIVMLEFMLSRLNKNSKNSSIPPSQDPNRAKNRNNGENKRKPGGQLGRIAKVLQLIEEPDEVISIPVDRTTLPKGHTYRSVDHVKRQVVELIIKSHVKEYRLEVLEDETGKRYIAEAPEGASRPIQYGASIKATSVYMNLYQMIPYARLQDFFLHQGDI